MKKTINSIALATILLVFTGMATAEPLGVKIIELNNKKEFVLIKNEGGAAVNLKGWQLHDQESGKSRKNAYTFQDLQLKPGEVLQVQSGISKKDQKASVAPAKLENANHYILWSSRKVWNDSGDVAYLRDREGRVVDEKGNGKKIKNSEKAKP